MRRHASVLLLLLVVAGCTLKEEAPAASIPPPPDVAGPPPDALKTPSGLASKVLQVGMTNIRPSARSTVRVNYTGWTADGKMFDSSIVKGQPLAMPLNQLIPGWIEGVQLMVVGEKRRFWIPAALAYGNSPDPNSPKGTLVFDIELLGVE